MMCFSDILYGKDTSHPRLQFPSQVLITYAYSLSSKVMIVIDTVCRNQAEFSRIINLKP